MSRWISPDYDAEWERFCKEVYSEEEYDEDDDGCESRENDDCGFDWDAYQEEKRLHEIDSIYEGTLKRVFG